MPSFINALAAATAAREQATDAQCRTMTAVPANGEARMTWEAKCRYRVVDLTGDAQRRLR